MSDVKPRLPEDLSGRYHLQRELGRGGMATVFLALDRKYDRPVAIKLMHRELAASIAHERFLREIRLAAHLAHPLILPLLDSGEVDGLPYYVMPYGSGESLRERMKREGRVELSVALGIIAEVGDALHYAHGAGIIHRDVKPDNILLLGEHAMITDFGVARAVQRAASLGNATSPGLAVGTPAYMSPEQATADPKLDGRSDQYSLAVVLFELIGGQNPFAEATAQKTIARRFSGPPPRLRDVVAALPSRIDAAVAKALSYDPDDRFETVAAFVDALRDPAAADVWATPRRGDAAVAVLPFTNFSRDPDDEYFSDGITEEIITALSRVANLSVVARSSAFAFKGRKEDVRGIAAALRVRAVLEGSVRRSGKRVRVSAQLVDARTGTNKWSEQYDRELDDVFAIQEDIARHIVGALQNRLLDDSTRPTRAHGTSSATAHDAYLRGRYDLNRRTETSLREAVEQFRLAAAKDPNFALAHAGLGEGLMLLGSYGAEPPREVMPRAREAAQSAVLLDPFLADAHTTIAALSALFDWDWATAESGFQAAIFMSPRSPSARHRYAMDCLVPQRRFGDALREVDEAVLLDPLSVITRASLGFVQHASGNPAGIDTLSAVVAAEPLFAMAQYFLGSALRDSGQLAAAESAFRASVRASTGTPEMFAGLAQTLALMGQDGEARAILTDLCTQSRFVSPTLQAQIYVALDEHDAALEALQRALDVRDAQLVYLSVRRSFAPLVGNPTFERIRRQVGVPEASLPARAPINALPVT